MHSIRGLIRNPTVEKSPNYCAAFLCHWSLFQGPTGGERLVQSQTNAIRKVKKGTWAILFPTLLTEIGIWEIRFQKEEEIVLSCIEASPQPVFCPPFLRPVQRKRVFLPGCPAGWKWGGRGGRRRGLAEMGERGKEGEGGAGEGLATATVTAIQTKTQSRTRQKVTREFNLQIW